MHFRGPYRRFPFTRGKLPGCNLVKRKAKTHQALSEFFSIQDGGRNKLAKQYVKNKDA